MNILKILSLVAFICICANYVQAADVPTEIAGIKLGSDIADYPDVEYSNYLKEVVVMDWHGFRKGVISYGICESPGTIVKLNMKYEDSSKRFFDKLLKKYKNKFGSPTEWKGDSFGIKHVWKWKFTDEDGRIVNLILKHNLRDPNQNIGNLVSMSYPELEEIERLCFNRKCEEITSPEHQKRRDELKKTGWNFLIPQ